MTAAGFIGLLQCVRSSGRGKYMARCPVHTDKSPSLSIAEGNDRILVHCHAQCETKDVVAALGLTMADLFIDSRVPPRQCSLPRPPKTDLNGVACRFELAALDRRLRADRVLNAVARFTIDKLSEKQLDRLMNAIGRAYSDQDRADFLETVADDLRVRAFQERTVHHAA